MWAVTHPAKLAGGPPKIVSSEVCGVRASDVERPYPLYGLPIKTSFKEQLKRTFKELSQKAPLKNLAVGSVYLTDVNLVVKAPYASVEKDRFLPSGPLKFNTVGPDWFSRIDSTSQQAYGAADIQRLHHLAVMLYRVANFTCHLGDAETLLRTQRSDVKKREGKLNAVLAGREEVFQDLYKLAHELLQVTTLMMRDMILGNAKRAFSPAELFALRYAPMWKTEYVFPPSALGVKEPESAPVPPPSGISMRPHELSSSEDECEGSSPHVEKPYVGDGLSSEEEDEDGGDSVVTDDAPTAAVPAVLAPDTPPADMPSSEAAAAVGMAPRLPGSALATRRLKELADADSPMASPGAVAAPEEVDMDNS